MSATTPGQFEHVQEEVRELGQLGLDEDTLTELNDILGEIRARFTMLEAHPQGQDRDAQGLGLAAGRAVLRRGPVGCLERPGGAGSACFSTP